MRMKMLKKVVRIIIIVIGADQQVDRIIPETRRAEDTTKRREKTVAVADLQGDDLIAIRGEEEEVDITTMMTKMKIMKTMVEEEPLVIRMVEMIITTTLSLTGTTHQTQ